jgi:hypothetical protein
MLTSALALVLTTQSPTITFRSNFETVGKVVERLAAESRSPLAVFGDIKNMPIYINVKNVPLSDLMKKISDVSGGAWEQKDKAFYLSASSADKKAQDKAGDAELIKAIEASINAPAPKKRTMKELEAQFKGQENSKDPKAMREAITAVFGQMFMVDTQTLALLKLIGAKDLSTIVDGRRVVLSSNPTEMQGALSNEAYKSIFAEIQTQAKIEAKRLAEREAERAAKAKKKAEDEKKNPKKKKPIDPDTGLPIEDDFDASDYDVERDMLGMFGGGGKVLSVENASNIATVMAAFQISNRKSLTVEIKAFTQTGAGVYTKTVQIPILNPEEMRAKVPGGGSFTIPSQSREYALALTNGSKLDPMAKMMRNAGGGIASIMSSFLVDTGDDSNSNITPLSKELRETMLDPVKNEPFAKLLGPVLDLQAGNGHNVVAMPSDELLSLLSETLSKDASSVEEILDGIDRTISQEVTEDGTWTIVKASSPLELRSAFCNRTALKNLISAGASRGYLNLEDTSTFAMSQNTARGSEALALPMITAIFRTSDLGSAAALTSQGFDALKLYASLSQYQRQALSAKRSVPLASLSNEQRGYIGRFVYNGMMPPMLDGEGGMMDGMMEGLSTVSEDADDSEANGAQFGSMMVGLQMMGPLLSGMFGFGETTINTERTYLLPQGVPVVGAFKAIIMNSNSLMATESKTGAVTIAPPELLAVSNNKEFNPFMPGIQHEYDSYRIAKQKNILLVFKLGNKVSYFTSLYDVSVDMSKTYKKEELPQKTQDRLKSPAFTIPTEATPAEKTPPPNR